MIQRALLGVLLSAGVVSPTFLTGCAEVVTYANHSREQGEQLLRDGAYSDAAGAFRNSIRQDPRDFRSHYYLGVCYDQTGEHQQAFAQYATALEVIDNTMGGVNEDPFKLKIIDSFAHSMARFDKGDVQISAAERRAALDQNAWTYLLVAKTYRYRGDADLAINAYRNAARWDIANFEIRKEFGLYLLDPLNQRQDAEYYLRQANRLKPEDVDVVAGLHRLGVAPTSAKIERQVQSQTFVPHGPEVRAPRD